jgi:hypothetical protein
MCKESDDSFELYVFQDIIVEVPLINGEPPATLNSSIESDASNPVQPKVK